MKPHQCVKLQPVPQAGCLLFGAELSPVRMNLLIIGGTRFVGRHLVEYALARGHTITLFNRGQSNPDLFPQVEQLHGDRAADFSLLQIDRGTR